MIEYLKHIVLITILLPISIITKAQSEEKIDFNRGVERYEDGNFDEAYKQFERSYNSNPEYKRALYNAGNAAYLSGKLDKAAELYTQYADASNSNKEKSKAFFNIGNSQLHKAAQSEQNPQTASEAQGHYKSAIKSFKNALKYNPSDPEAKYNLTYALSKLQQNQQNQQGGGQDQNQDQKNQDQQGKGDNNQDQQDGQNGEQQDQNQDGQNGDQGDKGDQEQKEQNGENGENGDQNPDEKGDDQKEGNSEEGEQSDEEKDGNQQNGQDQNGEPKEEQVEGQISRAQAIKDLDAINNEEGKTLQKVYLSKEKGDKKETSKSKKDW